MVYTKIVGQYENTETNVCTSVDVYTQIWNWNASSAGTGLCLHSLPEASFGHYCRTYVMWPRLVEIE